MTSDLCHAVTFAPVFIGIIRTDLVLLQKDDYNYNAMCILLVFCFRLVNVSFTAH